MIKLFVEFGYDVRSKGHEILQDFADNQQALDWFLDNGADINRTREDWTETYRRTGLVDCSIKVLNVVAARGDIQLFDHLVSRGADPQCSMALHNATKCQDPEKSIATIDHLLDKHHMNMETDDDAFRTNMMQGLADSGTPLDCAVCYQNLAAVRHLLGRGADPTGRFEHPVSQSIGACLWFTKGFLPALKPLLDGGADADSAVGIAIWIDKLEAAKICVAAGADPNKAISDQEARVARLAARSERGLGGGDPCHKIWDSDGRAGCNLEMEAFLRSAAADL